MDELGISKAQIEKLHTLPTSALSAAQGAAQRRLQQSGGTPAIPGGWGPILDGKIIPAHPFDPGAPAISANVPMLIGTCQNEMVNGTFHSSEITFAFDNATLCPNYSGGSADALTLSSAMGEALASMARHEQPAHSKLTAWPAYDEKTRATMIFNTPCAVKNDPEGEGLRLIGQAT